MNLRARLRETTQLEHQRLEDVLDLAALPASQARFTRVLAGFWGFHVVWEPSLRRHSALAEMVAERSRLGLLRSDLVALGLDRAAIDRLPLCDEAELLTHSFEQALGSLYVLEGSTLGGQLIARSLQQADWAPAGGLGYFSPYGPSTGAMWRGFLEQLEAASSPRADALIESGALMTFRLLRSWLSAGDAV